MNELQNKHHHTFEQIRQVTKEGYEFWSARDLMPILGYHQWKNFEVVVLKAIQACGNSGINPDGHFPATQKQVTIGAGASRTVADYQLSRYACYLIVQNADPNKPVIAYGQTYFAIQTRRQEIADDSAFQELDEQKKRVYLRNELREHNKQLVEAANLAGVESSLDFAIFQNHGYQGLYGGLDAKDIHQRKGLKKSQQILDHMGSTELAANLFRATQTEEKLRRDRIKGKSKANQAHKEVGKKVRSTIKELGGTMPEDLPTPSISVKALEKRRNNKIGKPGEHGR